MRILAALAALSVTAMVAPPPPAAPPPSGPLDAFIPFVGDWVSADGEARQTLQWGLERRTVSASTYFADPESSSWVRMSEGGYYWDPADQRFEGFAVAVNMGVDLFEITGRRTAGGLTFDYVTHAPDGSVSTLREVWRQDGIDAWAYETFEAGSAEPSWSGRWERRYAIPD